MYYYPILYNKRSYHNIGLYLHLYYRPHHYLQTMKWSNNTLSNICSFNILLLTVIVVITLDLICNPDLFLSIFSWLMNTSIPLLPLFMEFSFLICLEVWYSVSGHLTFLLHSIKLFSMNVIHICFQYQNVDLKIILTQGVNKLQNIICINLISF